VQVLTQTAAGPALEDFTPDGTAPAPGAQS
jgi:hypothetical protein